MARRARLLCVAQFIKLTRPQDSKQASHKDPVRYQKQSSRVQIHRHNSGILCIRKQFFLSPLLISSVLPSRPGLLSWHGSLTSIVWPVLGCFLNQQEELWLSFLHVLAALPKLDSDSGTQGTMLPQPPKHPPLPGPYAYFSWLVLRASLPSTCLRKLKTYESLV